MSKFTISLAAVLALGGAAYAAQGQKPQQGYELIEGRWVLGIAGGVNFSNAIGVTATGTTQAGASAVPSGAMLVDVDTSTASTGLGVALPFATPGTVIMLYNNTANNISVYPAIANNPKTSAQDTINNTTSVTVNAHTSEIVFSAKAGVWGAK